MKRRLFGLVAAVLSLLVGSVGASARDDSAVASAAAANRESTFETVWKIVDTKFYDESFNGVDWKGVHDRYAPLVAATKSDAELYPLLNKMLGELHASHFSLRPPEAVAASHASIDDASWGGGVSMTVRLVEDRAVVTDVEPKGPAALAGLRSGFVITRIGSTDVGEIQRRIAVSDVAPVMERFLFRRAIEALLGGMPGSHVTVGYLDGGDVSHEVEIVRQELDGKPLTFGQLPTVLGRVDVRTIADGIGYVRFNIFLPELMGQVRDGIASLASARGMIVDLRNNPGGVGLMAPAVASLFVEPHTSLGTMKMRRGEIRFVTTQQTARYTRPLVVLVDEGTASTSEIFAGALQEAGRAVVIGQPTLGAVLPSVFEKLPNGAVLQYAVADFKTPKGVLLEGRGVEPNVNVALTRRRLLDGNDPTLDAAIDYVNTKGNALQ